MKTLSHFDLVSIYKKNENKTLADVNNLVKELYIAGANTSIEIKSEDDTPSEADIAFHVDVNTIIDNLYHKEWKTIIEEGAIMEWGYIVDWEPIVESLSLLLETSVEVHERVYDIQIGVNDCTEDYKAKIVFNIGHQINCSLSLRVIKELIYGVSGIITSSLGGTPHLHQEN